MPLEMPKTRRDKIFTTLGLVTIPYVLNIAVHFGVVSSSVKLLQEYKRTDPISAQEYFRSVYVPFMTNDITGRNPLYFAVKGFRYFDDMSDFIQWKTLRDEREKDPEPVDTHGIYIS